MPSLEKTIFGDAKTLIYFVGVLGATVLLAWLFNYVFQRYSEHTARRTHTDLTSFQFIRHFVVGLIYTVGVGWALLLLPGLRTVAHTLLAGAGVAALVAGLASQQALSNITSGLFLVIFKPFRVHDHIKFKDNFSGVVEDITLRHTVVRDSENNRIIVPNSVLSGEVITNLHYADTNICQTIDMNISYTSSVEKALEVMQREALNHPLRIDHRNAEQRKAEEPEVIVRVIGLDDSSVHLRAWAWVKDTSDGFVMTCDLLESIRERFGQEGIEIPVPQTGVTFNNSPFKEDKKSVPPDN